MQAVLKALRSLGRPDIFWHMLWPGVAAVVLWVGIGFWVWGDAAQAAMRFASAWPWMGDWLMQSETARIGFAFAVNLFIVLLFVPLVFVTSAILVSALALPLMLDRIAVTDYADLEQRRGGSMGGSIANALWALVLFVLAVLLTLPLWLVPGLGLILSIGLAAWLNLRCYAYDGLMNHADREEMRRIPREQRGGLIALGVGAGVLAYVPVLNFFVPAFAGLAFMHYLLDSLRRARAGGRT